MKLKIFTYMFFLISFHFTFSCSSGDTKDDSGETSEKGVSLEICDCALMLDRLSSNTATWDLDFAKECVLKYGNLNDFNREMVKDALDMSTLEMYGKMPQIGKRLKDECFSNKSYSKDEIELACDCWENSYEASGKAFDSMSKSEQDLRTRCMKLFDSGLAAKKVCSDN